MQLSGLIYVLRSNDLSPDPRVEKYVNFFKSKKWNYKLVGWNRSLSVLNKDNTSFYHSSANYGIGMKNIGNIVRWNVFIFWFLFKERKNIAVIHACDFDTVLPALFIKKLFNKKVIFDIFDWYTDSRKISNRFLAFLINKLEHWSVKYSDAIIICEEERIEQLGRVEPGKVHVMQNIPDFPQGVERKNKNTSSVFSISYVGILSTDRGLEILLEVISHFPAVQLKIAGFGELEELIISYADRFANIVFMGKVSYETGLQLMNESDCIYAMYYKNIRNHLYAAPNKFYESLYLGKPLITTSGTLVGNKVEKYKTGFVIEEGYDNLCTLIKNLNKEDCFMKGKTAASVWREEFCGCIARFFENEYSFLLH